MSAPAERSFSTGRETEDTIKKAVAIGLMLGALGVATLIKVDSAAHATCEGCGQVAGFAAFASDLDVDNNTNRKFEDDGYWAWCIEDANPTFIVIEFNSDDSKDVNNVTVVPELVTGGQDCSGQIEVHIEGFLDELDSVGTCVIDGFIWSPLVEDSHTFTVHEL